MKRFRVLLAAGGLALVAMGLLLRPSDVPQSAESLSGIGRYRDGRGRFGREGPPLARSNSGSSSTLADGLLAYWKLDGNSTDELGGHNGTDDHIAYVTGKVAQGASPGVEFVDPFVPGFISFSALTVGAAGHPFTAQTWCKRTNTGGGLRALIGHGTTFGLFSDSGGKFNFFDGSNRQSSAAWTVNVWAHVVVTYDGTDLHFVVDNADAGTVTVGVGSPITWAPTRIGNAFFDSLPFPGIIDEVGIWSRVLTAGEITTLFNSGAGKSYPFN